MAMTRQALPQITGSSIEAVSRGGYILSNDGDLSDILLIGTGSEVSLCVDVAAKLRTEGYKVSSPCLVWKLFEEQDAAYKNAVMPKAVTKRLVVEARTTFGWHKYAGTDGDVVGSDRFGASAPGGVLMEKFGFTVDNVYTRANALLA